VELTKFQFREPGGFGALAARRVERYGVEAEFGEHGHLVHSMLLTCIMRLIWSFGRWLFAPTARS
jgi:hypothetical protein